MGQSNTKAFFKPLSLSYTTVDWESSSFLDLTLIFPSRGPFYSHAVENNGG